MVVATHMLGIVDAGNQLNELLRAMDATAANLDKLDSILTRAEPMVPDGPVWSPNPPEWDDLNRAWEEIRLALPLINGFGISESLVDPEVVGQMFIDYLEIGEPPIAVYRAREAPKRELSEYRYRVGRARRLAIRSRLVELMGTVDEALPDILSGLTDDPAAVVDHPDCARVQLAITEIDRLLGDTASRAGRWNDLWRHLHFSQTQDWRDVASLDWPDVKTRIDQATYAELDPIPVDIPDLGEAAAANPGGPVATALAWDRLDSEGFERLLFSVLSVTPGWQNVQWLMKTNAPDRGRDISAERVIEDATGSVRTERVIVQAKHWQARPVNAPALAEALAQVALWQPPVVHALVVATSGRFSADGVDWYEKHNQRGQLPLLEAWPDSHLERLLARHPAISARLR